MLLPGLLSGGVASGTPTRCVPLRSTVVGGSVSSVVPEEYIDPLESVVGIALVLACCQNPHTTGVRRGMV